MKTSIIEISGIYEQEGFEADNALTYDFTNLEGTCCYCSEEAAGKFASIPFSFLNWIDTGDYHYLSLFHGLSLPRPFELILLDNHSDDFDNTEALSCGNWVTSLEQKTGCKVSLIRKVSDYIPGDLPVFLSLDLDVLDRRDFRTNWDQGDMGWEDFISFLGMITSTRQILGIDICGGITQSKGASGEDLSINAGKRRFLQDYLVNSHVYNL